MQIRNFPQRSPEWYAARVGVATASRASDALGRLKNGQPSKACIDYATELAFERVSGSLVEKGFQTQAMARGQDLEPAARAAYESATGEMVTEIGFAIHDTLNAGCSPDGLVSEDGLIEIKCPFSQTSVARLWTHADFSEYIDQVEWQLWITGRRWCDIVIYDPRLEPSGMDLLVQRYELSDVRRTEIEAQAVWFLDIVEQYEHQLAILVDAAKARFGR